MGDHYALRQAAERGDLKRVKRLLVRGADVNATDDYGNTALILGAENGHMTVVEALLERDADLNRTDEYGNTALHFAAENGHMDIVGALLARDDDVHCTDKDGNTALHFAAEYGHFAVVEALLARHADLKGTDKEGLTALHFAAKGGHTAVTEALLAQDADVNCGDKAGNTSLIYAAEGGHLIVAERLLERGADVNGANDHGATALHCAANEGHGEMVQVLLERGADMHCTDKDGDTALHNAASNQKECVALALWRAGADALQQNNKGVSALSLLPEESDAANQMRAGARRRRRTLPSQADIREVFSFLASKCQSSQQTVTAQDAISQLQHILQGHLSDAGAEISVEEGDVEDVVMAQMDGKTCVLEVDGIVKAFYELRSRYSTVRRKREPPELRARFKNATRSKKVLRSRLAKRLLRGLFDDAGGESACSRVSFRRSSKQWKDSDVDALLADHETDEKVDEEAFAKVGMKVLFC